MNPIIDPISKAVVPNTLYKYRASDSIGFILLENQELYISSPNFNDPFDCNIPLKIELLVSNRTQFDEFANQYENYSQLPEVLKEEVWKGMRDKDVQAEYVQFQTKQFKENFGVYCLSGDAENLLMWSHYGGSHSGFCLGMDMNLLTRLQKFTTIGPVHYTNIYPHIAPQKYDVENV